jgi:tetratricopeptide (TPR) repeat protein
VLATSLEDFAGAAQLYEKLFDEDPSDCAAWEPMLATYRAAKDVLSLARLLPKVVDAVDNDADRARLRLESARLLVDLGRGAEAIAPLHDLVVDDPNQIEAATLLADLLEQAGRRSDLAELLGRQIDAAKDRQDSALVERLSLRRAGLLDGADDRDEARATLYSALDWVPESRAVLGMLVTRLEADGADELLDVMERLLRASSVAEAEARATDLAARRSAEGNPEAAERALEIGYRIDPSSRTLHGRLEASYRATNDTLKLAELYAVEARGLADVGARVARLREVAALYGDELSNDRLAAETLREAFSLAKTDTTVASDLVRAEVKAGNIPQAVAVLTEVLDLVKDEPAQRASWLLERAALRVELEEDTGAAEDLIAVARLGVRSVAEALAIELERVRARAEARGDTGLERSMRVELATALAESGDFDAGRALLMELLRREPKDRDALRLMARIEERAQRWDAAAVAYRRLIPLEEGDLAVDTALRLADACEHAGRLADARGALERARIQAPLDQALRHRLERLYESVGAHRELAEMSLGDARDTTDASERCSHLKRAAALLLQDGTDTDAAIDALTEAHSLAGSDMESTLLLADAYTLAGRTKEASDIILAEIAARGGKRSPELGSLYHRLARTAHATGDRQEELRSLVLALEADPQNGFVAAELATLALELEDIDVATRALRGITLLKDASASHIPKAVAYQYLGELAHQQGDQKRAILLLKRALDEDPALESARSLLDGIRAQGA